ncbi:MAG TPA: hypothetical protein PKA41_08845 [Verrucomicrobiota bacterium]|nr:hypothetical protein [Verrucomicrobiota bacterium]
MKTITNDYKACEVWNLGRTPGERGPFIIVQSGDAPGDELIRERMYLLRRDGHWVEMAYLASLHQPEAFDSVMFPAITEVLKLFESLGSQVRMANLKVDEAGLERWLVMIGAGGAKDQFEAWAGQFRQRLSDRDRMDGSR